MSMNKHDPNSKLDWETPQWLVKYVKNDFPLVADLCADEQNAVTPFFVTKELDIFSDETEQRITANSESLLAMGPWFWINPPYEPRGRTGLYVQRAVEILPERYGFGLIALIPASVGSAWWRRHVYPHFDVLVFPPRFGFVERGSPQVYDESCTKSSARFDCALAFRTPNRQVGDFKSSYIGRTWPWVEVGHAR